jgi:hypothetical protein
MLRIEYAAPVCYARKNRPRADLARNSASRHHGLPFNCAGAR